MNKKLAISLRQTDGEHIMSRITTLPFVHKVGKMFPGLEHKHKQHNIGLKLRQLTQSGLALNATKGHKHPIHPIVKLIPSMPLIKTIILRIYCTVKFKVQI